MLWNRWAEEWVILYDDSTMAWFTEPGRSSPSGKILVKEAPEMLAIAHWTGQIPRRPPLPDGVSVSQLIALGSRRKRSKVYWMLAKSEQEVGDWIDAITKTLPPPPQIELVVDKPHLMNVLRRPLVRIRREYETHSFFKSYMCFFRSSGHQLGGKATKVTATSQLHFGGTDYTAHNVQPESAGEERCCCRHTEQEAGLEGFACLRPALGSWLGLGHIAQRGVERRTDLVAMRGYFYAARFAHHPLHQSHWHIVQWRRLPHGHWRFRLSLNGRGRPGRRGFRLRHGLWRLHILMPTSLPQHTNPPKGEKQTRPRG